MKLLDKVEYCLKNFPETRNSDVKLTNCIWVKFFNSYLLKVEDYCSNGLSQIHYAVKLTDLYEIPREDHIKRYRARFNERGLYLPTDEKVLKQRKLLQKSWHLEMSPSNPSRG